MSRNYKQKEPPSAKFLNLKTSSLEAASPLTDRGTAFIGATTGFLPPKPLPSLPQSHSSWEHAASALPQVCRTATWTSFISTLPNLPASSLPDENLLRANMCLGAIAHAIRNIGGLEIPEQVFTPWKDISRRLQRPTPSFNSLDWFIYNYDIIEQRFCGNVTANGKRSNGKQCRGEMRVTDVWRQTRPMLSVTGCMTEAHFITSCHAIEHAAATLPGDVVRAQRAVIQGDITTVSSVLMDIAGVAEKMTHALRSCDVRPLSTTYTDPVEWGRCIGVVGLPVVPGEKTISGLLFPSVHLLDVFFSRGNYATEMGRLEHTDRRWLPPLHREFLSVVAKVSVLDFVRANSDAPGGAALSAAFSRALCAFAGEAGFLGKHRLRITAFLELSMKVGRPSTAAGTESAKWQRRAWRRINAAMLEGMRERQTAGGCSRTRVVTVQSSEPLRESDGSVQRVVLNTDGSLIYAPGDHVAIWPRNSQQLVDDTLNALRLKASQVLHVRNPIWLDALRASGYPSTCDEGVKIRADEFLEIATLQPFDADLGQRIADEMFVSDSTVLNYLRHETATNVPIVFSMLASVGDISPLHLATRLDNVLLPLRPRFYSVASHMRCTPTSVEIIVGRVRYESNSLLGSKYGDKAWVENDDFNCVLMPSLAEEYLSKFLIPCDSDDGVEPTTECEDCTKLDAESLLGSDIDVEGVCKILKDEVRPENLCTGRARHRAKLVTYDYNQRSSEQSVLEGVSSSYLSSLKPGDRVQAAVMPELDFRIPTSTEVPIVMIALGTGVAPFRSFLKELISEKQRHGEPLRKAWIILGVKSISSIPFLQEIEDAVCVHKVADLSLAFSREDVDFDVDESMNTLAFRAGKRKHVQGLFEEDVMLANRLWSMLSSGGHIFACGRPELEPLVRDVVAFAVKRFAAAMWGSTFFDTNYNVASLANEYADRLAAERRLHVDVYYSGKPSSNDKIFTYAQVAGHRTTQDCWVVFRGGVYDISRYLAVHPGGPKILFDKGGRDMSEDFNFAHGAQNSRVASQLEPYKIGSLHTFRKTDARIRDFMQAWSVPLLHTALEHRSVFLLDCNRFSAFNEPASFSAFKSQIDAPGGTAGVCDKFWRQYEPDMFRELSSHVSTEKLGKLMQPIPLEIGKLDTESLLKAMESARVKIAGNDRGDVGSAEEKIVRYTQFMEDIVNVCAGVQQIVERSLHQSISSQAFEDVCVVMISDIVRSIVEGLENAYIRLSGERQGIIS